MRCRAATFFGRNRIAAQPPRDVEGVLRFVTCGNGPKDLLQIVRINVFIDDDGEPQVAARGTFHERARDPFHMAGIELLNGNDGCAPGAVIDGDDIGNPQVLELVP